jgi:hypothetical protein
MKGEIMIPSTSELKWKYYIDNLCQVPRKEMKVLLSDIWFSKLFQKTYIEDAYLASQENTPVWVLEVLYRRATPTVLESIARNPNIPLHILENLFSRIEKRCVENPNRIMLALLKNPNTPISFKEKIKVINIHLESWL